MIIVTQWTFPLMVTEDELDVSVSAEDESSEELLAQEIIRPKATAMIVGKNRNFSFFIEPKYALDTYKIYSN